MMLSLISNSGDPLGEKDFREMFGGQIKLGGKEGKASLLLAGNAMANSGVTLFLTNWGSGGIKSWAAFWGRRRRWEKIEKI